MPTWEIRITGLVQGVFFRAFALDNAVLLGVHGWVRNEFDGSVGAIIQHESAEVLHQLCDKLREGPPHSRVSALDINELEQSERYERFEILR